MTSHDPYLADCSKCFALCCVALSFDRGDQFGHDKPAGVPCHNLNSDFTCKIHARREELGYDGCEAFDCMGAGPLASAVFAGENWHGDSSVARRLYARFSILLRVQEMRQALETASELNLPADLDEERIGLLGRLVVVAESREDDGGAAASSLLTEAKAFLKRLAPYVGG